LAENRHNLSECSESSDSGSGDGGTINKSKPMDRDGFTLVTKRKRNYRNHEFKNPTKSVYKQQPNGSSAPQSSKEYNGANSVLGLHGDSAAVEENEEYVEREDEFDIIHDTEKVKIAHIDEDEESWQYFHNPRQQLQGGGRGFLSSRQWLEH
jgi:hypothetical protein